MAKQSFNFSKTLLQWHSSIESRDMPWVGIDNPYYIWLSEVILQQTRVDQGRSYYLKFVKNYPTVFDLANASEDRVLSDWQGLGYYSRARNLHQTAKTIVEKHRGVFPNTYEGLIELKGIGKYTASAIASFAYSLPIAVIDGNVMRVLSRIYGIDSPIDSIIGRKQVEEKATTVLDPNQPGAHNQAIMDFGAMVCKPKNPICSDCFFRFNCFALEKEMVDILPIKEKKILKRDRYFLYQIVVKNNSVLLQKRGARDIWEGLYQFPLIELTKKEFELKLKSKKKRDFEKEYTHILTHQKIKAIFVLTEYNSNMEGVWVEKKEIKKFALPKLLSTFIEENSIFTR